MLEPGAIVGSYEIVSPIAAGGMGVVYRARHRTLGSEVAIKTLLANFALNDSVRQRFQQEAYVQAQLQHDHIVRVIDLVDAPGGLAIVMDLVPGLSFEAVLAHERPGPWAAADVITVLRPVVDAMAFAHGRGVVHRDLKPANVLLQRRDGIPWPGVVKVTDFGLAKILDSEVAMTRVGSRMGTLPYMAPEQFSGSKDLDARADVFALGMMLWRMLAGRLPVDPEDMVAVTRIYTGERPMPRTSDVVPGVDPSFSALASAALAVDPSDRISDARAFLHALDDAVARLKPAAAARPAPRPVAIPLPAAVPTAAPSVPPPSATSAPSPDSAVQSSNNSRAAIVAGVVAMLGLATMGAVLLLARDTGSAETSPTAAVTSPSVAPIAPTEPAPESPASPIQAAAPADPCPEARGLEGSWRFTTRVEGSKTDRAVGINGYYRLEVRRQSCELSADLEKTGYAETHFKPGKGQEGRANLRASAFSGLTARAEMPIHIARSDGNLPLDVRFHLVAIGDELFGWWRYDGADWSKNEFWGILRGHRGGQDPGQLNDARGQPCIVGCHVECGTRGGSAPGACLERCKSDAWSAPVCR